jgi:hypothetical protein
MGIKNLTFYAGFKSKGKFKKKCKEKMYGKKINPINFFPTKFF